jgi:4-hydroxy-tetrahydrodipicolinate synthase
MVALVTPFKNGAIDEEGLCNLVQFQIEGGTEIICPCGTTGESATLSFEEHRRVVEIVVGAARGKAKVIAGTGSNNTSEAIELSRHARTAGADGCLLITPYYNKPTPEGLYLHYKAIAESVELPMVLYNVPGRTALNMAPETVARLAAIPNIIGIKEASGSLAQISEIVCRCGDDFDVISGDDVNTLPLLAVGGKGVISVTANIAPQEVAGMVHAFQAGRLAEAQQLHRRLLELHNAMFLQTNPIPVKTALGMMGRISSEMRLPLCAMPKDLEHKLKGILQSYGLVP